MRGSGPSIYDQTTCPGQARQNCHVNVSGLQITSNYNFIHRCSINNYIFHCKWLRSLRICKMLRPISPLRYIYTNNTIFTNHIHNRRHSTHTIHDLSYTWPLEQLLSHIRPIVHMATLMTLSIRPLSLNPRPRVLLAIRTPMICVTCLSGHSNTGMTDCDTKKLLWQIYMVNAITFGSERFN